MFPAAARALVRRCVTLPRAHAARTSVLRAVPRTQITTLRAYSTAATLQGQERLEKASKLLQQEEFDEAFKLFSEALTEAQAAGDKLKEIQSLQGLSVATMGQGEYFKSVEYYEKLLSKTEDDVVINTKTYLALAALHIQSAQVDKALVTLNKGLEKTRDLKRDFQIRQIQKEIAWAFIDTGARFTKIHEVKNFLNNVKFIARKDKDLNFEIDALMRAAKKVAPKSPSHAKEFLSDVINVVKQNPFAGLQREHWQALMELATICKNGKENTNAESNYKQALDLAKNLNDPPRILNSLQGLGTVYIPDRISEAIPLYQEIIKFCKDRSNFTGEVEAIINLGIYYTQANDNNNAEIHFKQAQDAAKKYENAELEVLARSYLAVYHLKQKLPTAKAELKDVIEAARPLKDKTPLKNCLNALGDVYLEESDWNSVIEVMQELLPLQQGEFQTQLKTVALLGKAYKELGDDESARKIFEEGIFSGTGLQEALLQGLQGRK